MNKFKFQNCAYVMYSSLLVDKGIEFVLVDNKC